MIALLCAPAFGQAVWWVPDPEPGTPPGGRSWIAAEAYSAAGDTLSEVHLAGVDGRE